MLAKYVWILRIYTYIKRQKFYHLEFRINTSFEKRGYFRIEILPKQSRKYSIGFWTSIISVASEVLNHINLGIILFKTS